MRADNASDAPATNLTAAPLAPARPVQLSFLLVPQFSLLAFSAAIEPLRSANRLLGSAAYEWRLLSLDGAPVAASNGISIAVHGPLEAAARADMLVVCAGLEPLQYAGNRTLVHRLRYLASHGCRIGAVSGGSFILADAGLLAGRRCTVHWEYREQFAARYPQLTLTQDLYVIDGEVFTCSGGTAALDMMLHFVREHCGADLALAVAEQFLHPGIREHGLHQRMELRERYGLRDAKLIEVIRVMEQTVESPLYIQAITARVGLSVRQVERLFRRHIGESPAAFYLRLRLERGRRLLLQTSGSIPEVALGCGFGSRSHFAHAYKRHFGRTPAEERRTPPGRAAAALPESPASAGPAPAARRRVGSRHDDVG
jgi:AraC family transcriptional regulator, glycine betaine-responsive activator